MSVGARPVRRRGRVRDTRHDPPTPQGSAPPSRLRLLAFGAIVVGVLGVGGILAVSDLLGQRGTATTADAIPVRMSMAGFDPGVIHAKPGQTLAIDFWTTDAAPHLQGGVHTWISPDLGLNVQLPAESRKQFTLTAPATPGDYDFWCDTCCGGKASPTMHGTLHVEA
jgi:plastocyanin